jgi:uncharacterized protein YecT (DUF1311 family)
MKSLIFVFACLISVNFWSQNDYVQVFTNTQGENLVNIQDLILPNKQSALIDLLNTKATNHVNSKDKQNQDFCASLDYRIFLEDFTFSLKDLENLFFSPKYQNIYLKYNDDGDGAGGGWECLAWISLNKEEILKFFEPEIINSHHYGCIDVNAINYNPFASKENDSCEYKKYYSDLNNDGFLDEISLITKDFRTCKTLIVSLTGTEKTIKIDTDILINSYNQANYNTISHDDNLHETPFSPSWITSNASLVANQRNEVFIVSYSNESELDHVTGSFIGCRIDFARFYLYKLLVKDNKLVISEYSDIEYFSTPISYEESQLTYDFTRNVWHRKNESHFFDGGGPGLRESSIEFGKIGGLYNYDKFIEINDGLNLTKGFKPKTNNCAISDYSSEFMSYDSLEFNTAFNSLLKSKATSSSSPFLIADSLLNLVWKDLNSAFSCLHENQLETNSNLKDVKNELLNSQRSWLITRDGDYNFYLNTTTNKKNSQNKANEIKLIATKERIKQLLQHLNHIVFNRNLLASDNLPF